MHQMVYPERRRVSEKQIRIWYEDAIANGEVEDRKAVSLAEMKRLMEDAGLVAFQSRG